MVLHRPVELAGIIGLWNGQGLVAMDSRTLTGPRSGASVRVLEHPLSRSGHIGKSAAALPLFVSCFNCLRQRS